MSVTHYKKDRVDELVGYLQTNQLPQRVQNYSSDGILKWKRTAALYKLTNGVLHDLHDRRVVTSEEIPAILNEIYSNPATGLAGRDKLYKYCQSYMLGITQQDITNFLAINDTASVHKMYIKKRDVNTTQAKKPMDRFQIDYVTLSPDLCCVIDVYSRYAWCVGTANQTMLTTARVLRKIFGEVGSPRVIQSDNAFIGPQIDALKAEFGIFWVYTPTAGALIERFNRSICLRISKYCTLNSTRQYIRALPLILKGYNDSVHATHQRSPSGVFGIGRADPVVTQRIKDKSYRPASLRGRFPIVRPGDKVRILQSALSNDLRARRKQGTLKGYLQVFSETVKSHLFGKYLCTELPGVSFVRDELLS